MTQDNPIQKLKNFYHKQQSLAGNIKFGFPAKKLKLIAVTGTDGKTTTTSMIYHVLKSSGLKTGYISTIGASAGGKEVDTGLHVTTPDPFDVPRYLRLMLDEGIEYVVLESTSSGLQQNRLWGVSFDAAIITNIRRDHLDYHGTWENYARAKLMLADKLKPNGTLVINKDDEKSYKWIKANLPESSQIEIEEISKSKAKHINNDLKGMGFEFHGQDFQVPLIGEYNLENVLGVIEVCSKFISLQQIKSALETFEAPKGRMQTMQTEPVGIIIDFAHTPGALDSALAAVRNVMQKNKRLIVVYSCAGKRDEDRRRMGAVSAKYADISILSVEDPRDESVKKINDQILEYAEENNGKLIKEIKDHKQFIQLKYDELYTEIDKELEQGFAPFVSLVEDSIQNRQDAIILALKLAQTGDVVFITGKGHEKTLAFGKDEKEIPWNDQEGVRTALELLAKG